MTRQKSFKNQVRARMDKTGESYTTARRRLQDKLHETSDLVPPPAPPQPPADPIKALAQADSHVRERTGRGWDEWFALLDEWGATRRTHTEIARWLFEDRHVDHWWSQNIAVTYEQTRGMRAPGQGSDGYFIASGTKTIYAPVDRVFEAFADPGLREEWLPGIKVHVRTATAPKTFRADWEDEPTRIAVAITAKGEAKAHVAINHEKITDADTAAQRKAFWRDRLGALKDLLETGAARNR